MISKRQKVISQEKHQIKERQEKLNNDRNVKNGRYRMRKNWGKLIEIEEWKSLKKKDDRNGDS